MLIRLGIVATVVVIAALYIPHIRERKDGNSLARNMPDVLGKPLMDIATTDIILRDSASNIFDESNFAGRVFLLVFYQSDCDDCKAGEKELKELGNALMKKPFQIIFIHNGGSEPFEDFRKLSHKKINRLYDEDGLLARALGITAYPSRFLIDHEGIIREFTTGWKRGEQFQITRNKIDSLVTLVPAVP